MAAPQPWSTCTSKSLMTHLYWSPQHLLLRRCVDCVHRPITLSCTYNQRNGAHHATETISVWFNHTCTLQDPCNLRPGCTSCSSFMNAMMRSLPSSAPPFRGRVRMSTTTSPSPAPCLKRIVKSSCKQQSQGAVEHRVTVRGCAEPGHSGCWSRLLLCIRQGSVWAVAHAAGLSASFPVDTCATLLCPRLAAAYLPPRHQCGVVALDAALCILLQRLAWQAISFTEVAPSIERVPQMV